MSDHHGRAAFDRDDELRALLAAGDPASSLPQADPAGVARLLEDIMTDEPDIAVAPPVRRRNPFVWVAAAAAAVLVVGLGTYAFTGSGDDGRDVAADPPATSPSTSSAAPETVLTLLAPAPTGPFQTTRCRRPTAQQLALREVAFEGTVTSISGGYATLRPATFYSGTPVTTVRVEKPIQTTLLEGLTFKVGQTYLISATGGQVSVCGLSGPASGEVANLYDRAFN